MPLPSFADADDLRVRLGLTKLTAAQTQQAQALLQDASSLIRSTLGLTVTSVDGDVALIEPGNGTALTLPEIPASQPTEVRVSGLVVTDWTFDGGRTLTRTSGWQALDANGAVLRVQVTYSHGYTEVPDEVVRVCCQAAVRAFGNPTGVLRSELRGDFPVSYDTTTPGVYLTDGEVRALGRALKSVPRAKSVQFA